MPPRKKPSSSAYRGAVAGDHSFLNTVTMARTKPPIRPPQTYRPPVMPSAVISTLLQAKAAVITASTSSVAVLPMVPLRVIAPSAARETTVPLPRSRKVDSFRTGLPLRIMEVGPRKKGSGRDMRIQGKRFQGRCKVNGNPAEAGAAGVWCERGDSNPHALRHWYLKPGRLPIPPLSRWSPGRRHLANKKAPGWAGRFGFGGPSRIRTLDLLIKSQLLYQL